MTTPVRLSPDPSVALVAYRFPSESKPGTYHDVALMLGEAPEECPATLSGKHWEVLSGQTRIACEACAMVLRFWACDCGDAVYRERPCRHIQVSMSLYAEERRRGGG